MVFLGKALNSRLDIVGLGIQNHTNRRLLRLPASEWVKAFSQGIFVDFRLLLGSRSDGPLLLRNHHLPTDSETHGQF